MAFNSNREAEPQIAEYIIEKIEGNEFKEGDKIPSEWQLSRQFQVNRYLVREAMGKLRNLGYIYSLQGKGSFVNTRPLIISYSITAQASFSKNINEIGKKHQTKLLSWIKDMPTEEEKKRLEINDKEQVYRLEILRYVEEQLMSVTTTTLAARVVPNFEANIDRFYSLYKYLDTHYQLHPIRKYAVIKTVLPSRKDIELLNMPKDLPILQVNSLMVNDQGDPVEFGIARIRGDVVYMLVKF
jgi:DNA-binding GntR family transcriptional regulator